MSQLSYRHTYKRNLPHIQPPGATLFVTFRLAGSLPKHVVETLREELKSTTAKVQTGKNTAERDSELYQAYRRHFGRWDATLDKDESELDRIVRYVINNPVKAGLIETWTAWPWTYSVYEQKD